MLTETLPSPKTYTQNVVFIYIYVCISTTSFYIRRVLSWWTSPYDYYFIQWPISSWRMAHYIWYFRPAPVDSPVSFATVFLVAADSLKSTFTPPEFQSVSELLYAQQRFTLQAFRMIHGHSPRSVSGSRGLVDSRSMTMWSRCEENQRKSPRCRYTARNKCRDMTITFSPRPMPVDRIFNQTRRIRQSRFERASELC